MVSKGGIQIRPFLNINRNWERIQEDYICTGPIKLVPEHDIPATASKIPIPPGLWPGFVDTYMSTKSPAESLKIKHVLRNGKPLELEVGRQGIGPTGSLGFFKL